MSEETKNENTEVNEATEVKEEPKTEVKEEPKTEETGKKTSGSWTSRIWSVVVGVIVGAASMFGINQTQISSIKNDIEQLNAYVKTAKVAIDNKDWAGIIEAVGNITPIIKRLTGEGKEAIDTGKETLDQYKASIELLKDALEKKDYATAASICNDVLNKIVTAIPEDKLTGKTKEVYDIVKQINDDIKNNKNEHLIELVTKIIHLFKKDSAVPAAE